MVASRTRAEVKSARGSRGLSSNLRWSSLRGHLGATMVGATRGNVATRAVSPLREASTVTVTSRGRSITTRVSKPHI